MRFFGSGISPWTQISYEGTIFDAEYDDLKIFRIFENFGKSRNQFWDPPICSKDAVQSEFDLEASIWNVSKVRE